MAAVSTNNPTIGPAQSILPSSKAGIITPTNPNNVPAELNLQQSDTNGTWGNASVMSFHGAIRYEGSTILTSDPYAVSHDLTNASIVDLGSNKTLSISDSLYITCPVPNDITPNLDMTIREGKVLTLTSTILVGPANFSMFGSLPTTSTLNFPEGYVSKQTTLSMPSQFHKKTEIGDLTLWHKAKFVDGLKADTVTINMADGTIFNLKSLKSASEVTFDPKTGFSGDNLSYEIENVALDFSFTGESVRASLDYDQEFTARQATHLAGESSASDSNL